MASDKITMARRMMTKEEISAHKPPFLCKAWGERAAARKARLNRNKQMTAWNRLGFKTAL